MAAVPVVSLAVPEAEAARVLRRAAEEDGFCYVVGHGVGDDLLASAFEAQRRFFALPLEQKLSIAADSNYRGFTPFAEETLDPQHSQQGDTHEGLYFGREVQAGSDEAALPLHGPNQWPAEELVPGYRAITQQYFAALEALGFRVLRLLALSLGLEGDHFLPFFTRPMLFLRPLHYSADKSRVAEGVFAAGAHTDYGMITLLASDGEPGLQICTDGRTWRDVPPLEGAFHCNLGDMLCRWTNGLYRSTLHRVINSTGRERHSLVYFFEPSFTARVEPLPQCLREGQEPLFAPTTAGAHILDRYQATHAGYGKACEEATTEEGGA